MRDRARVGEPNFVTGDVPCLKFSDDEARESLPAKVNREVGVRIEVLAWIEWSYPQRRISTAFAFADSMNGPLYSWMEKC
jgi:hypothetical protein